MEEAIYRMSLTENFLILIIIGLWVLAVINLARKLERICNPPPIYPNYSAHNKTNLSPSTLRECYPKNLMLRTRSSTNPLIRATSEPMIDASPRATIVLRSPSETFLHAKSSILEPMSSSNALELEQSDSSFNMLESSTYQIQVETRSKKSIPPQLLLHPRRIPSIVRRSLLDLHRRALMPNTSTSRYFISTIDNRSAATVNIFPSMKKTSQQVNTIDDDEF